MTERKAKTAYWAGKGFWGCTYDMVSTPGLWGFSRCSKKAKHDLDDDGNPTRCGIHCEAAQKKREAKSAARYKEHVQKSRDRHNDVLFRTECVNAVRKIAEGHNDARGLAQELLQRFGK